jgi:hypothetical protein
MFVRLLQRKTFVKDQIGPGGDTGSVLALFS